MKIHQPETIHPRVKQATHCIWHTNDETLTAGHRLCRFNIGLQDSTHSKAAEPSKPAQKNQKFMQESYKVNHDENICFKPKYKPGYYVFVSQPILKTSASERLTAERHLRLMLRRHEPYHIIRFGPEMIGV